MSGLPKYQIIREEESVILFFPHSLDIITMKAEDFKETREEQIVECSNAFFREYAKRLTRTQKESDSGVVVSKIMLNLSDACNLQCEYCYADKYHNEQKMSPALMEKVINRFFLSETVAAVKRIVFFGGEPLLNFSGMEYFIGRLEELLANGEIAELPIFNIITNGTIYNDRIGELFKKYNMGIIVSCDGPRDLHDKQRPFRKGKVGSYDVVSGNIKRMLADGLNMGIECTVTKLAVEQGYTRDKLKDFFKNEFGLEGITFVQENITMPGKAFDYSEFHEEGNVYFRVLENLEYDTDTFEVPYRLIRRSPFAYPCGLGRSAFHILANGDIYPCQLLSGMEEFKIADIDSFNDSHFRTNAWTEKYKTNSGKCDSCWAKPLCKFCSARQLLEKNSYVLSDSRCEQNRELLRDLIINMVELRKDPKRWEALQARLKKQEVCEGLDIRQAID